MDRLRQAVGEYVERSLSNLPNGRIRSHKMIHDTIHGSNLFQPHEIAVLDLPLLQRLRRVNQVDVVPLVFPSGNHNRFEHTLGVTVIADRLARALQKKDNKLVSEEDIRHIRMAAIMHDCGHGPFSHMSEEVYKVFPDMKEVSQEPRFHDRAPHEILSHLIVTSAPFRDFAAKILKTQYGIEFDLDLVADMIIGWVSDPAKGYLIDIISGAFDADKLDYIQRDSHFTGIKMVLDLDRLFYTVCVVDTPGGGRRLSVDMTGVSTLEQIMFSKMMLHSTVYHHHKVRAAECLFRSIFDIVRRQGIPIKVRIKDLDFSSAVHFLYLTDVDIYSLYTDEDPLNRAIENLRNRWLFKRALVISKKTVTGDSLKKYSDLTKLYERPGDLELLREAIYEQCKPKCDIRLEEIWVDLPKSPSFIEGCEWPIKQPGSPDTVRLRDVFPVDEWTTAFAQNKWQGFVFCPPEYREVVQQAAKKVILDAYGIEFNEHARTLCKMDDAA